MRRFQDLTMILWLKYHGHPFDTYVACKNTKLWSEIQPGDYELWEMGKNSRWIITSNDPDEYRVGSFILPKSREELKIWLDLNNMKIGKRIGFSECCYQINEEMGPKFWEHMWVGYELFNA